MLRHNVSFVLPVLIDFFLQFLPGVVKDLLLFPKSGVVLNQREH